MSTINYSVWSTSELIAEIERLKGKIKCKEKNKEHYTIMSICRDNLDDIGVVNSKHLSDDLMQKIVSWMQEKYYNFRDEETFIEYLELSVDGLGIERIEV